MQRTINTTQISMLKYWLVLLVKRKARCTQNLCPDLDLLRWEGRRLRFHSEEDYIIHREHLKRSNRFMPKTTQNSSEEAKEKA